MDMALLLVRMPLLAVCSSRVLAPPPGTAVLVAPGGPKRPRPRSPYSLWYVMLWMDRPEVDRKHWMVHNDARNELGRDIEFDIGQAIGVVNTYRRKSFPKIP